MNLTVNQAQPEQLLVTLCAWCNKIRNPQGAWSKLDEKQLTRLQAEATHTICPACARNLTYDHASLS